jgi:hypothetical protein
MVMPRNKRLPGSKPGGRTPTTDNGPRHPNSSFHQGPKHNKPDKKKKNKNRYGALGSYPGVNMNMVNQLVGGVLRDEMRDLRRQKQAVRRESEYLNNKNTAMYERGMGDLNYVHGEVGDYLNNMGAQNMQMFQGQMGQQEQANAALQGQLQGTFDSAQGDVIAELNRLGISGGANTGGIVADRGWQQAQGAQQGANALQSMGMMQQNSGVAQNLIAGMNQGSLTQGYGQNLNAYNDAQSATNQDRMDQLSEINNAMWDAQAGRKDVFFQLLQQLQQTGWSQYMQAKQAGMLGKKKNKRR